MISFVVPAHNEEQHLAAALEAIHVAARSTNEPYEIVLADDDSGDRTHDIAVERGAVVVDVNYRHIAATRNAGARAASGEVLFFVDADTIVTPDVVPQALQALRTGAIGGGATVRFDGPLPLHFRLLIRTTVAASRATKLAFGCFIFCRRDAFDAVGGFNETLY
ncbi:MAG: glycosyltransferase, partial [Gemmatimonadaceae bacterium]